MAAFRLQLFVGIGFEDIIAGEKLQVSIEGFSQPKKKKDFISKLFKDKKEKKQAQMYYLYISLCTYILSAVFIVTLFCIFHIEGNTEHKWLLDGNIPFLKYWFYDCYT